MANFDAQYAPRLEYPSNRSDKISKRRKQTYPAFLLSTKDQLFYHLDPEQSFALQHTGLHDLVSDVYIEIKIVHLVAEKHAPCVDGKNYVPVFYRD